ncbi:MAG: NAD(P)/FAD-dependent oxidoreductase [Candidatus Poribacteria bacterium]|nr:NAD(P)/FAD-dependent oxidoreductase [Candidatus Poribacteria bacterium]
MSAPQFDVIIIGGGPAGCTAAYHLRRLGFHVLLVDGKTYPCDKLCGEVLSPESIQSFVEMGAWKKIEALQPAMIDRVLITTPTGNCYRGEMPGTAIGLSRYQLDWTLWAHCESAGVKTIQGFKVQRIEGALDTGFNISGTYKDRASATFHARFVIGAFGKRSNLDRVLRRRFWNQHHGYVAFKAHFAGIELQRWVELHSFAGGYCGLCHIESKKINLCLIVKESVFRSVDSDRQRLFAEVLCTNPVLKTRLDAMHRISPKFLSIGQICFAPKRRWERDVLMVGDAAALITPLCGDGMAMAMRSAECCVPVVADYLRGHMTTPQLKGKYLKCWADEFRSRLRWGRILQFTLFRPLLASGAVALLSRLPTLGAFLIARTRDAKQIGEWKSATPQNKENTDGRAPL